MELKELRSQIDQRIGQRNEVLAQLSTSRERHKALMRSVKHSERAQAIIQEVSKITQSQLEIHISDIVTMALETIFDDPYKFEIEFVVKRNKTECELHFVKNGIRINPLLASGGGVIDIASFALRIALWTLQTPRSRNVLILDEPFRFVSKDLIPRVAILLKELKHKLNLQMIIVTHIEELAEEADKIFRVTIKKGISNVKTN